MNLELTSFCRRFVIAALSFSFLAPALTGECVIAKAVRVRRVCGQVVNEKGQSWPGTLRLTRRDASDRTKAFEQIVKTDDEGRFDLKDISVGEYEVRLTPAGMKEVFVPVLAFIPTRTFFPWVARSR